MNIDSCRICGKDLFVIDDDEIGKTLCRTCKQTETDRPQSKEGKEMKKKLLNAEVVERSFLLGVGEEIWYRIDYRDHDGVARQTIHYGKDIDDACRKLGIDWLEI